MSKDNKIKNENSEYDYMKNWRSWGSWFSWGSPVGLGIFLILTAAAVWILASID